MMQAKHLNQKTEKIFYKIVERLNGSDHCRIGKKGDAFMPLSVEKLSNYDIGTEYSLCHYFEQNGDLCQDPEMVFLLHRNGHVYPMMFQQAIPSIYQESIFFDDGWKLNKKLQADHTRFANMWIKNIKEQQNL